jgi:hypothetical protein
MLSVSGRSLVGVYSMQVFLVPRLEVSAGLADVLTVAAIAF